MKVCLLYENRERAANAPYYDQKSIIQDILEELCISQYEFEDVEGDDIVAYYVLDDSIEARN